MSILDMDVTARRDAGSIRAREFATVRKGYDPAQVRSFLDTVATWVDEMETDLAAARAEARAARTARASAQAPPAEAQDPFESLGTRVAEVLRTAEEHAKRVREEADAAAEHMLEEARAESQRSRTRAQEETDSLRQAAQEHADLTRRSAQEEADRVRDEAANALETARVEAERTVAGLFERRSALAAELHATRTRLMGIVTQLEEENDEDAVGAFEQAMSIEPPATHEAPIEDSKPPGRTIPTSSYIPSDDPRRDPVPPEIPSFVAPSPPRASFPQPVIEEADGQVEGAGPVDLTESPNGTVPPTAEPEAVAEPELVTEAPSVSEPGADEAATPEPTEEAEARPDEESPAGQKPSFLRWTNEEEKPPDLDMSLPDFPTIDIPSLEDEEKRRD